MQGFKQKVTKTFNTFLHLKSQIWHGSPALSSRKEAKSVMDLLDVGINPEYCIILPGFELSIVYIKPSTIFKRNYVVIQGKGAG